MGKTHQIKEIYEKFYSNFYSKKFSSVRQALEIISEKSKETFPHPLGKFIIFYSIPSTNPKIVMVGNNPSWFYKSKKATDKDGRKKAEKNLEDVAEKLPVVNSYKEHDHKFGNQMIDVFNYIKKPEWIDEVVGLNRFFIQTGGGGTAELKKECKKLDKKIYTKIEKLCNSYTRELVEILNPNLVILIGDDAKKSTFPNNSNYPRTYDKDRTSFVEAVHPSNRRGGWIKTAKDIQDFMRHNSLL